MKKYEAVKPFRIDFTKIDKPPKIKHSNIFENNKTKKPPLPNKDSTKKNK